jgi:histidine triad (HIT) family protein
MENCIFCKIIKRELPGEILYQDDLVTAFYDIHPVAPVHILIVPNKHIPSLNQMSRDDESLIGHLFTIGKEIAFQENISNSGYRIIINTGPHASQTVFHLHAHLLGGKPMKFSI